MSKALRYLLAAAAAVAVLAATHYAQGLSPYLIQIVVLMGVNVILAASLNLINGFTGQFSLGHAGFMAVGAYVSAAFTYYLGGFSGTPADGGGVLAALTGAGMPLAVGSTLILLLALLMGGVGAAVAGLLVGLPTLRLRGDYLAIATLGFGEIVRVVISQVEAVGGPRGFSGIPQLTSVTWVAVWLAVTLIFLRNLLSSSHGRALVSVREDEIAASAVGVDTTRYKVLAFTIGAFFAGVAGGLFAHYLMYLHPNSFTFIKSIEIVVMVVLGGSGSLVGSASAALILTPLSEVLRTFVGVLAVAYVSAVSLALARPVARPGLARWVALLGLYAASLPALLALRLGGGKPDEIACMGGFALAAECAAGACIIAMVIIRRVSPKRREIARGLGLGAMLALGFSAAVRLMIVAAARQETAWMLSVALIGAGAGIAACLLCGGRSGLRRAAIVAAAVLLFAVLLVGSGILPKPLLLAMQWIEANVSQLRLVIYAGMLVGLMLARPAGLLGGYELTWGALRSLISPSRRPSERPAVVRSDGLAAT